MTKFKDTGKATRKVTTSNCYYILLLQGHLCHNNNGYFRQHGQSKDLGSNELIIWTMVVKRTLNI